MFAVDRLLLVAAALILCAILSRKIGQRLGIPMLVLFLALGMLAGSEGFGGIHFEDYEFAHGIGTAALVVILFDGGLRTPVAVVRRAWKPAAVLATLGVLVTATVTGLAAHLLLDIGILQGLLLGSIVASTDAAAVFAALRSQGVRLPARIAATLELESGVNDPMAIFLTVSLLQIILGEADVGIGLAGTFLLQMAGGAVLGLAVGYGSVLLASRLRLDTPGLYPLMAILCGFLAHGSAAAIGGSGFLAVYVAGMVMGNRPMAWRHGVESFADTAAWLGQIVMFVLLGLLSFPSRLVSVGWEGTAIAVVLAFLARPLAVFVCLKPLKYSLRELSFLSWVGLRGAVPIVLATYPLLFGVPIGPRIFDIVFFAVLLSAVTQGWTLAPAARRLGLAQPLRARPSVSLEIASVHPIGAEIVHYYVDEKSRAARKALRDLELPEGAVVAIVVRESNVITPRGSTRIEAGDQVYVVTDRTSRAAVDRAFRSVPDSQPSAELVD
jgi:cell volume regulation protein A